VWLNESAGTDAMADAVMSAGRVRVVDVNGASG
jgi:hypothetical protein